MVLNPDSEPWVPKDPEMLEYPMFVSFMRWAVSAGKGDQELEFWEAFKLGLDDKKEKP